MTIKRTYIHSLKVEKKRQSIILVNFSWENVKWELQTLPCCACLWMTMSVYQIFLSRKIYKYSIHNPAGHFLLALLHDSHQVIQMPCWFLLLSAEFLIPFKMSSSMGFPITSVENE